MTDEGYDTTMKIQNQNKKSTMIIISPPHAERHLLQPTTPPQRLTALRTQEKGALQAARLVKASQHDARPPGLI